MKRLFISTIIPVFILLGAVFGQNQPSLEISQEAAIARLSDPVYPALARQARIMGEVRLRLRLHDDGTVESVEVINGHPLLKQAASESAAKSEFVCPKCDQGSPINFVYSFEIRERCHFGPHCERLDSDQPLVTTSPNRVTISASPLCTCDPSATLIRIRAAKCFYLWKCGRKETPTE